MMIFQFSLWIQFFTSFTSIDVYFLDGNSSDDWVAFMLYLDATLEAPDYDLSQSDHANTEIFEAVTRLPYEEVWVQFQDQSQKALSKVASMLSTGTVKT